MNADSFDLLLTSLGEKESSKRFDAVFESVLRETEVDAVFFCNYSHKNEFVIYERWKGERPDDETFRSMFCFDYAGELLKNPAANFRSPYLMNEDNPEALVAVYQSKVGDETEGVFILLVKRTELYDTEMLFGHIYSRLCSVISFLWRQRDEKSYLEQNLERVEKLENMGKLADGIAHDVSNLLSGIFGSVAILKEIHAADERSKKLISVIEQSATKARELTRGLLSFGKPTPKLKETLDVVSVADDLVSALAPSFPADVSLKYSTSGEVKPILGNSTQIYQVLMNLCVNAKEAMPSGGTIEIALSTIVADVEFCKLYPFLTAPEYLKITVTDTGTGIPADVIEKIFEPYMTTKEASGGTGLGLYITFGIVKAHNGFIDVSSTPGKGTTFTLFFPALHSPVIKPPGEKIVVLVDDEVVLQDLLGEMLEAYGYDVVKAESGEDALKLLHDELKADLIIVDYQMPGMNGMQFTEELRRFDRSVPVILSTGNLTLISSGEPERCAVTRVVPKPYELETILKVVEECIGKGMI